jgi:hypothetical protein
MVAEQLYRAHSLLQATLTTAPDRVPWAILAAEWAMTQLSSPRRPRRRSQLLHQIGVRHDVAAADVDETPLPGEPPATYVERLAKDKAHTVASGLQCRPGRLVLAADTTVVQDGRIFGKPADESACVSMLSALAGRTHEVLTAVRALGRRPPATGPQHELRHIPCNRR